MRQHRLSKHASRDLYANQWGPPRSPKPRGLFARGGRYLLTLARKAATKGFSTRWAVASAVERVIVTSQAVATNPSRHRTKIFPFQKESRS